ncbi:MAG TPA: hypothetical protein VH107_15935 [Lacipirellulaceae bacterium]|jgi:hypothetical protein|nr:hypothetical protein [Lacipirellulaceae bacterium]
MQIRAEDDPRYWRKFLIMGLCALGFALWCLKDGVFSYPAHRIQGFDEFKQDYKKLFKDDRERALTVDQYEVVANHDDLLEWAKYAEDRHIPRGPDIAMQFIMASVMSVAGLFLVSLPLRARGRWIEGGDEALSSSWGESFRYEEVEEVNKRRWRSKGIAKVTYVSDARRRTFAIDDYKYERYKTDAILYELEQRIDPGRITNGPPEPPPEGRVAEILGVAPASEQAAPA